MSIREDGRIYGVFPGTIEDVRRIGSPHASSSGSSFRLQVTGIALVSQRAMLDLFDGQRFIKAVLTQELSLLISTSKIIKNSIIAIEDYALAPSSQTSERYVAWIAALLIGVP
jgi:hypothetical protein